MVQNNRTYVYGNVRLHVLHYIILYYTVCVCFILVIEAAIDIVVVVAVTAVLLWLW